MTSITSGVEVMIQICFWKTILCWLKIFQFFQRRKILFWQRFLPFRMGKSCFLVMLQTVSIFFMAFAAFPSCGSFLDIWVSIIRLIQTHPDMDMFVFFATKLCYFATKIYFSCFSFTELFINASSVWQIFLVLIHFSCWEGFLYQFRF